MFVIVPVTATSTGTGRVIQTPGGNIIVIMTTTVSAAERPRDRRPILEGLPGRPRGQTISLLAGGTNMVGTTTMRGIGSAVVQISTRESSRGPAVVAVCLCRAVNPPRMAGVRLRREQHAGRGPVACRPSRSAQTVSPRSVQRRLQHRPWPRRLLNRVSSSESRTCWKKSCRPRPKRWRQKN